MVGRLLLLWGALAPLSGCATVDAPPAARVLVARAYIAAPYHAVWERLTVAEAQADWFSSPCRRFGTAPGDELAWGDERVVSRGELLGLERGRGLAFTWAFVGFGCDDERSRVDVEVRAQGDVVLLTVTHDVTDAPRTADLIGPLGWQKSVSRLKTLLETGEAMPWPVDDPLD